MKYTLTLKVCTFIALSPFLMVAATPVIRALKPAATSSASAVPKQIEVRKAQPTQAEAIADLDAALKTIPGMDAFVIGVRPGQLDNLAEIMVTTTFENQTKADRESLAAALRKAWHVAYGHKDPDKAKIWLVNSRNKKIGGSRAIAGSLIYVDD